MSDTSFDPFTLPSAFDPPDRYSLAPTGQSACSRHTLAPTGQSACSTHGRPPRRQRGLGGTATAEAERPLNPRLAHLLPAVLPPATDARPSSVASDGADTSARLAKLEDEVAILTARLDNLLAIIDHKLADHQDRLLRAVASLVAQRR